MLEPINEIGMLLIDSFFPSKDEAIINTSIMSWKIKYWSNWQIIITVPERDRETTYTAKRHNLN